MEYPLREDAQFDPDGQLPNAEQLARLCMEELAIDPFWVDEVQSIIFDALCEPEEECLGWLCRCGHFEDSAFHCSKCQAQPPYGCPCYGCRDSCNYSDEDELHYLTTWSKFNHLPEMIPDGKYHP